MSATSSYAKSETTSQISFFSNSIVIWSVLVGYLILVKGVILPLFPPIEVDEVADLFTWTSIVVFNGQPPVRSVIHSAGGVSPGLAGICALV